ncbi:MAG: methyl-accepting chemotaxis protein [Oligoflexales bacterium]
MLSLRTKVFSFIVMTLVLSVLGGFYLYKHFLEIKKINQMEVSAHRVEITSARLSDCLQFTNLNCHKLATSLINDLSEMYNFQGLVDNLGMRASFVLKDLKDSKENYDQIKTELEALSKLQRFDINQLNLHLKNVESDSLNLQAVTSKLTEVWYLRIGFLFVFGIMIMIFIMIFGFLFLKKWQYRFDEVMTSYRSQQEKLQEIKKKANQFEETFDNFSERENTSLVKSNELINIIKVHSKNLNTHVNNLSSEGSKSKLNDTNTQLPSEKLKFIIEQIQDCNKIVNELKKTVGNINTNIDTIKSISLKTQLLAINAAVEASKAGHLGKGFTVVAEEMGKLSIVSRDAANAIKDHIQQHEKLLKKVDKYTYDAVDNGLNTLEAFDKIADQSSSYINSIIVKSTKIPMINAKYTGKFNLLSNEVKALNELNDLRQQVQELSQEINRQVKKQIKNEDDLIKNLTQLVAGNQYLSIENFEKYFFDLSSSKKKKKIKRLVS